MIITIKSLPVSKNIYMGWHWGKKDRYLQVMKKEIWGEGLLQKARAPKDPYKKARLTFKLYFRTKQRKDAQNYTAGGLIAAIDSLVQLGYIKDDNYNVIGDPRVEIHQDKEKPRMEIVIEHILKIRISELSFIKKTKEETFKYFESILEKGLILRYERSECSFNWVVWYIEGKEKGKPFDIEGVVKG